MTAHEKPEVYLEVGCGFLRIPTEAVNYNITLLAASGESAPPGRVSRPAPGPEEVAPVEVRSAAPRAGEDGAASFHEQVCRETYNDLNRLVEEIELSMAVATSDLEVEADELGLRLRGAARQTREVAGGLDDLRRHAERSALAKEEKEEGGAELAELRLQLTTAMELITALAGEGAAAPEAEVPEPVKKATIVRYPFDLDTVFQTIYELCTNETVKSHISGARAKAETIFAKEIFWSLISPKVASYPVDDGFVNVPMSDMFPALGAACKEKAIVNLFKKMDSGQSSIFLDQSLPLELPAPEEMEESGESQASPSAEAPPSPPVEADPRLGELRALVAASLLTVERLVPGGDESSAAAAIASSGSAWAESVAQMVKAKVGVQKLEAEIEAISTLLPRPTEAAHPGGMELLADSRLKLQALAITLSSQLQQYEEAGGIGFGESRQRALEEAEEYLNRVPGRLAPLPSPLEEIKEPDELVQLEGFAELAGLGEPDLLGSEPDEGSALDAESGLDEESGLDGGSEPDEGSESSEESAALKPEGVEEILGELKELEALDLPPAPPPEKFKADLSEQNDIDKLLAEMGM